MSNSSNKVSRDFFGQEVPVAFMEMVRQTYIFEGKDPNKIYSIYQAAKKKLQLTSWQETYLLERLISLHLIRNDTTAPQKTLELIRHVKETPSDENVLILNLTKCKMHLDLFCKNNNRELLDTLAEHLNTCAKFLPQQRTIFDGRYYFYRAAWHAYQGDWPQEETCLTTAIEIFKTLRVSYLETTCHLLALKCLYTINKSKVIDYYNANNALFQEYPILDKAAMEIELQTCIWFRDHTISYLEKENWKELIKNVKKYLKELNTKLETIQKKLEAPL